MTEPTQAELIDKAVALGDRHTKTLGLLTPPAYRQAAENGGLLVAVEADQVFGYALFGLPKRSAHIRLAHLCVAEEQRGRGIARLLVEALKQRYPQRLGIKAKCGRTADHRRHIRSPDRPRLDSPEPEHGTANGAITAAGLLTPFNLAEGTAG